MAGIAYNVYNDAQISLNNSDIELDNVSTAKGEICGIAYHLGYQNGKLRLAVDNSSIQLKNSVFWYICAGISYRAYNSSDVQLTSSNITILNVSTADGNISGGIYQMDTGT